MSSFHFLRVEFLLFLIPAWLLVWWLLKQQSNEGKWKKIIEPKLLKHLLVIPKDKYAKVAAPWHLGIFFTLLILALSGPSWQLKESAFAQNDTKIALIVATSKTMLTTDITPTRLSRATMKIEDLLTLRVDTQSMLIAYSGTAHLVLPLTSDHSIIKTFAQALNPDIMPLDGSNIQEALLLAQSQLKDNSATIVVLTDSISASSVKLAIQDGFDKSTNIIFWQIASTELSPESDFQNASSLLGGEYVKYSRDGSDVDSVSDLIEKNFKNDAQNDNSRYEDGGYIFIPLLFLLLLLWAREGFVAQLWRRA
ncbi:MAG: VWA domain-containing protein [Sulfurovum sp.]|nr:VWA domain-containing protein [Sulfurovaceae bacterium]